MIPRDMLSGTRERAAAGRRTSVADAICFDVAYDDGLYDQVTDGAELVVVQTSNAMFIHTAQIEQQFEISRLRAIELGRSLAVARSTAAPGIVGPTARSSAAADPRTHGGRRCRGRPATRRSRPARPVGHWVGRLSRPLTVLVLLRGPARLSSAARTRRPRRQLRSRPRSRADEH